MGAGSEEQGVGRKKLEAMTTRYETLKEVASSSKESNFDQLRKRTEQTVQHWQAGLRDRCGSWADIRKRGGCCGRP